MCEFCSLYNRFDHKTRCIICTRCHSATTVSKTLWEDKTDYENPAAS